MWKKKRLRNAQQLKLLNENGMEDVTLVAPPSFTITPPNLEPSNTLFVSLSLSVTVTGWKPPGSGTRSLQVSALMQLRRHPPEKVIGKCCRWRDTYDAAVPGNRPLEKLRNAWTCLPMLGDACLKPIIQRQSIHSQAHSPSASWAFHASQRLH